MSVCIHTCEPALVSSCLGALLNVTSFWRMQSCVIQCHVTDVLTVTTRHPLMNLHTRLMDGHLYLMKRRVLDLLAEER